MRKTRTTLITAISIGLLAGSMVGVAAQEIEVAAPSEFTAKKLGLRKRDLIET